LQALTADSPAKICFRPEIQYMADSFYDTQSFEMFFELTEQGELNIVSKKNQD